MQGSIDQVRVTSAWSRDFAYRVQRHHDQATGWIRLYDDRGDELAAVRFDLSTVNRDRGVTKGQRIVRGDMLLEASITRLVKIPDFGVRMAFMTFESIEDGTIVQLGRTTRAELERVVRTTQVIGPLGAPTVRTHWRGGPVNNRYDIVCLGDAYRASDEAQFVADVDAWVAHLFTVEPYKTYKRYFNVHSVFRDSVENLADKPGPCTNPPVARNTVYDTAYCTGGLDRCLYINNPTLASQDAALAPDVEGRVVVMVNDPKYGGCASTFAVAYNGSLSNEVQTHEFGHSFGGLADEYDTGQSGTYSGPEPQAANITADSNCPKWSLWKGFNGIGCFQGAGYYKTGLYRAKADCLMRSNGQPLCEVCREELVLKSYSTVDPIEAYLPDSTSVTLVKPATRVFQFFNLVPPESKPRVLWYVDNILLQNSELSNYSVSSETLGVGSHLIKCEVYDFTPMVRKDVANKRIHSLTWNVTVMEGGAYTTYGSSCGRLGTSGNGAVAPAAYATKFGTLFSTYPIGKSDCIYQQVLLGSEIGSRTIGGIALRLDETYAATSGSTRVRVRLGDTTKSPATLGFGAFDTNFNLRPAVVVYEGPISWTANERNKNEKSFGLTIPFSQPFKFDATNNLLVEIENLGTTDLYATLDAAATSSTTSVWATPVAAEATGVRSNYGLVMCFLDASASRVLPAPAQFALGSIQSSWPFAAGTMRYQQIFDGPQTTAATIASLSLRYGSFAGSNLAGSQQIDMWLGQSSSSWLTMTPTFDTNFAAGTKRSVFSGTIDFPLFVGANTDPNRWDVHIPFRTPYVLDTAQNRNLLLEVVNTSPAPLGQQFDTVTGMATSRVYSGSTTAANGTLQQGVGLAVRLNESGRSGTSRTLELDSVGLPTQGRSFEITLAGAPRGAVAAVWLGLNQWSVPMPSHLAPGCSLYASFEVLPLAGRITDSSGFASVELPIPGSITFHGVKFYNEWFVFDQAANALGMTFSNGGAGTIGG
ncbi:MAG: hypothetical protein KDC95_10015 [Planctomycetes bacterium]|nr:hypothetical protein [Planctomycetota bacterium]